MLSLIRRLRPETTPGEGCLALGNMVESIGSSESRRSEGTAGRGKAAWLSDWLLLPTVAVVVAMDQISKLLVRANLEHGESWPSEGVLRLTHGTNTGSAFGLFPDQTAALVVASVIAIGFLAYFYRAHALPRRLLRFAIALQLGGALGNLIDRVRAGAVVDFIDLGWWPVFNLADSAIVVGIALLLSVLILGGPGYQDPGRGSASLDEGDESR